MTRLVGETDHVALSRLVTEHAWRVDNGRADTVHELYVDDGELDVGGDFLERVPVILNHFSRVMAGLVAGMTAER